MKIPVNAILPNPDQPRTVFDDTELAGLAQSIQENDLIQPIIVEQAGDQYILIDRERRWRAVKSLGWQDIEVVIRPASKQKDGERLIKALVANVQRSQMGPVDEGEAYQKMIDQLGSVEKVVHRTGVSNATVYMRLALLELAPTVKKLYNLKKLPIDSGVIALFKKLPTDAQERLASLAVTRHYVTATILRMGTRLAK